MSTLYSRATPFLAALLLGCAVAGAEETPKSTSHSHTHDAAAADTAASPEMSVQVQAAVSVADRLGTALKAGDLKAVESLLDADVLILESGGAERSRKEYLSHHASSDAKFLKDAHVQLLRRTAKRSGDLVWIGSESEIHYQKDGKPATLRSTETMILKQVGESWKIVHIHWSSRPKS